MRFQKIFQHSVGLSGLALIAVALANMDFLMPGIVDILLSNPLVGGLLAGTPMIPLIHSSEQKIQLSFWEEVDHSEFSGTAGENTASFEFPVSGWAHKVETSIFQETVFDQDIISAVYWASQFERVTWESGTANQNHAKYLVEHWSADSVTEMMVPFPIHHFVVRSAIDNSDEGTLHRSSKFGGPGKWFEAGSTIWCTVACADIGTPTTGNLHVKSVLTIIVACFKGKHRNPDEMPPWVYIVGEMPANGGSVAWPAFTNGRIVNARLTGWYTMDPDNEGYLTFDKYPSDLGFTGAAGQIEAHSKNFLSIILPVQEGGAGGQTFKPVSTNYRRGPLYIKKGESVKVESQIGTNMWFSVEFQFIPDFKYTSEFSRRSEFSDIADSSQFMALFTVPYGMYITTIETEVQASSTSAVQTAIEIMGIKGQWIPSVDGFLENFTAANVEGNLLGADNQAGAMPWTLDTIPITIGGTGEGTTSQSVSMELVGDYYPPGSQIGVWLPNDFDTSISTFDIHLHIEATNMIKTRNAGSNILSGPSIARIEEIFP